MSGTVPTGTNQNQGIINTLLSGIETLGRIAQILSGVTISSSARYGTIADLPPVTVANVGQQGFLISGRNTAQGPGAGTGTPLFVDNTGAWAATWSGVAPTE